MENVCKQCATALTGRRDAQYCSDACRKAHKRSMDQTEPTTVPTQSLQQQYDELLARYDALQLKHDTVAYQKGIVGEMIEDFLKDNPHLRELMVQTYFAGVFRRRQALGEGDQLVKYSSWRKESQAEIK